MTPIAPRPSPNSAPPAADWPIAAAMLQFPGTTPDGAAVQDAPAEVWHELLQPVVREGFSDLELPSTWIRVGDLSTTRLRELAGVLRDLRLRVPGVSVVRRSVISPEHGSDNLALSHRTIDAAAALGVPVVCLGLHDALLPAQRDALWFWTVPGPPRPEDPAVRESAVRYFRELADHAGNVGVQISLELYEDTFLGIADEAVRFLVDIGSPAAGLNPDIANLVRRHGPVDSWEHIAAVTLPHANYWHVKNLLRMEDPARGIVLTAPAPLESGFIDYRRTVTTAIAAGFRGAFVVEHYGGDGLSIGRANRDYLQRVLPA